MSAVSDVAGLVHRLRAFAAGCRGSMWQSRDETIRLCDEAADLIEALRTPPAPTEAVAWRFWHEGGWNFSSTDPSPHLADCVERDALAVVPDINWKAEWEAVCSRNIRFAGGDAPETPGEILTLLALWQNEHEHRPASIQQTAVTSMFSQMRDVVDEHRQPQNVRAQVLAAYPDVQQQIWAANAAPHRKDAEPFFTHPPQPDAPGWRDIATAPRDGGDILLTYGDGGCVVARPNGDGTFDDGDFHDHMADFTHWQPIPPPPSADTKPAHVQITDAYVVDCGEPDALPGDMREKVAQIIEAAIERHNPGNSLRHTLDEADAILSLIQSERGGA